MASTILSVAAISAQANTTDNISNRDNTYGLYFDNHSSMITDNFDDLNGANGGSPFNVFQLNPDTSGVLPIRIAIKDVDGKAVEMHLHVLPMQNNDKNSQNQQFVADYQDKGINLTIQTDGVVKVDNMVEFKTEEQHLNSTNLNINLVRLDMLKNYHVDTQGDKTVVSGEALMAPATSLDASNTSILPKGVILALAISGLAAAGGALFLSKKNTDINKKSFARF